MFKWNALEARHDSTDRRNIFGAKTQGRKMKDLAAKAFKFIGASVGVLVAAYTLGWSGAITLHNLFKTEKAEAISYVKDSIVDSEDKIMRIHDADIRGINGKMDTLVKYTEIIMKQNAQILNRIPKE